MHTVMLLNPKGGSGKTTLATSLAGYLAARGVSTVLHDHDPQASSTRWLGVRPTERPRVHGVAAFHNPVGMTRSWHMRLPRDTEWVVVDTPAGVRRSEMTDLIAAADTIVIPVLPSPIDMDAVSTFIQELRSSESVRHRKVRVAAVVNRVRHNCEFVSELKQLLERLELSVISEFRDSRNYARAGASGLGIHELNNKSMRCDRDQWRPLLEWLMEDAATRALGSVRPAVVAGTPCPVGV